MVLRRRGVLQDNFVGAIRSKRPIHIINSVDKTKLSVKKDWTVIQIRDNFDGVSLANCLSSTFSIFFGFLGKKGQLLHETLPFREDGRVLTL